ncbi:MAG: hypothetical protein FJX53_12805 [Alphaproteobacteria bacterium]|nr:hypothetical protein [Alphaproteobacteria bacterium]
MKPAASRVHDFRPVGLALDLEWLDGEAVARVVAASGRALPSEEAPARIPSRDGLMFVSATVNRADHLREALNRSLRWYVSRRSFQGRPSDSQVAATLAVARNARREVRERALDIVPHRMMVWGEGWRGAANTPPAGYPWLPGQGS